MNITMPEDPATILIIGDHSLDLRRLTTLLSDRGYRLKNATDESTALTILENLSPDLILLAVELTPTNGYEVGRRLKTNKQTGRIPIIFISDPYGAVDRAEVFAGGGADYLLQPFQTEEVLTRIEQQLRGREAATQLAVAVENARLYAETQERAKQLTALNKANRAMASTLDLDIVLKQVMNEVKTLLNAEGASVLLHDPANDDLFFSAVVAPDADALAGMRLPLTEGIAGWVMHELQPVLVDDVQHDPRFYDRIDNVTGLTTQSLLAVPLIYKDKVIGVVEVINKAGERFTSQDLELLEALTSSAAIAIENARLYQDLQERMKAQQKTQTQLIQSEKIAALGRLVVSITHEINNPLQSVQTCLTLTKEEINGAQRQEKIEKYLDIVESEIQRISTIVRRMRDFYRPAATQGWQLVNLRTLVESVLALTGKQLQHSNIVIEGTWSKKLPDIQANPDHLKQVFLNLILNAIDAMPQGGKLYISTHADELSLSDNRPSAAAARLEFRDTGEGMSEETITHLFEPFFTTRPTGSGLGLCISYNIIEAHNGQMTVASRENQGTTFTILLPIKQPNDVSQKVMM